MRVNVLTAVSRPANLPLVAESLARASERAPNVQIAWRWTLDLERRHVGGQALKNDLLEQVPEDEWVWILDDDTLAHEDAILMAASFQNYDAIVFSQLRSDGRILPAKAENCVVGSIDIGQAFMRRALIGEHRLPIDYNADGMFLGAVLAPPADVLYHPAALSLHNAISGVEVSV